LLYLFDNQADRLIGSLVDRLIGKWVTDAAGYHHEPIWKRMETLVMSIETWRLAMEI